MLTRELCLSSKQKVRIRKYGIERNTERNAMPITWNTVGSNDHFPSKETSGLKGV